MHKSTETIAAELLAGVIREDGATISPRVNGSAPLSGYMVAGLDAPALAVSREDVTLWRVTDWVARSLNYLSTQVGMTRSAQTYLGAWRDSATGTIYFDLSEHHRDRRSAVLAGVARHEVSVWDIAESDEIRTLPKHYDNTECYAAHESRDCPRGHTYPV